MSDILFAPEERASPCRARRNPPDRGCCCHLASRLFDLPLDRAVAFDAGDPPAKAMDFYLGELFRFDGDRHPDAVRAARVYLSTRERLRDRIRYLSRPARLAWKYLVKNPRR